MIKSLNYFGTDLRRAGHYFFALEGDNFYPSELRFSDLPFNPEGLANLNENKGTVHYITFDNYKILWITGSCIDKRCGCKSVFWTTEDIKPEDLKEVILSIPIARKIIEQMPFKVMW